MLTSSNKSKNTYLVEYGVLVLVGWMIKHAVGGGESEDDERNKTKQKNNKNNNQTDSIIGVLLWVTMVEWSGDGDG